MIYVLRHGETDLNKEGRLQGRDGMPLNESGVVQAENIRERLKHIKFDYVYSSPQERAIQTAEIVSGLVAITDPRLDVFDLGEADRLKKGEVKMKGFTPDPSVYRGVEDSMSYMNRVFSFMHQLDADFSDKELNILIVGHRCSTGSIGAYFNGIPEDKNILRYSSDNGEFNVYEFRKSEMKDNVNNLF